MACRFPVNVALLGAEFETKQMSSICKYTLRWWMMHRQTAFKKNKKQVQLMWVHRFYPKLLSFAEYHFLQENGTHLLPRAYVWIK